MSNATLRTLRHFHEIGLLVPAFTGENGYRFYEREQLLCLQQILLLRDLDLSLVEIAQVLDGHRDTASALREHLQRLENEQARIRRLRRTVRRTLRQIEQGDIAMSGEDYFDGFQQKQYE